ncbi:MAG TPA: hypothetical protein VFB22_04580 [Candidatus Baltobacteraceae bacterium]|nr:hypothetical protein [Candidatus Baltobacteraceae bacterium]
MADRLEVRASFGSGDVPNMDALLLPSWRPPTPEAVGRAREMRQLMVLTVVASAVNVALSCLSWAVPGARSGGLEVVRGVGFMCAGALLIYVSVRQWKLWRAVAREAAMRGDAVR